MSNYDIRSQFQYFADVIDKTRASGHPQICMPVAYAESLLKEFRGTRAELLAMRELLTIARIKGNK